jgi:hypothetical protein
VSDEFERLLSGSGGRIGLPEALKEVLRELATEAPGAPAESLGQFTAHLEQLRIASQGQTEAVAANTQAVLQNTVVQASGEQRSALATAGSVARTFLGSGLGVSPLISGLLHIFRSDGEGDTGPVERYVLPAPIHFEGAISGATGQDVYPGTYGEEGKPRMTGAADAIRAPHITVQVQAIDSRSFLDHSDDIARAVREAMLHSHALNDVVSEL